MLTTVGASKAWALQAMCRALSALSCRCAGECTWPGTPSSSVRKRWLFANDWEVESGARPPVDQHKRDVQLPPPTPGLLPDPGPVEQNLAQLTAPGQHAGVDVGDLAG